MAFAVFCRLQHGWSNPENAVSCTYETAGNTSHSGRFHYTLCLKKGSRIFTSKHRNYHPVTDEPPFIHKQSTMHKAGPRTGKYHPVSPT